MFHGFYMTGFLRNREACCSIKVTVCKLDLDIDSDNDGTVETGDYTEDFMEMDDPGKYIWIDKGYDDYLATAQREMGRTR